MTKKKERRLKFLKSKMKEGALLPLLRNGKDDKGRLWKTVYILIKLDSFDKMSNFLKRNDAKKC